MAKESGESIKIIKDLFSNKTFQIVLTAIIFLIVLISSTNIRLSNLPLLKDQTDGQYILSDLDALYFLRLAEVLAGGGNLSGVDNMRYIPLQVGFSQELTPYAVAAIYKFTHFFNKSITLRFIDAISPAIFYALAMIIFFFLVYVLTKSKTISLLASTLLAYSPVYLFRTMTGVSDHEALGMIPFFAVFLVFVLGMKRFNRSWKETVIWGALTGFFTTLTMAAWGGALSFVLMIIPLSLLIYYLFNIHDEDLKTKEKNIMFYLIWMLASTLFALLFNFSLSAVYSRFFNSYGIIVPFVLAFIVVDYLIEKFKNMNILKKIDTKFRIFYSLIITIIIGFIGLFAIGKNPLSMISDLYIQLLHPFGLGRTALTVAENAQPYLTDWIGQTGQSVFWLFVLGMIIVGVEIGKNISGYKHRLFFILSWIVAVSGILFSRISESSLFNGTSFISQAFYVLGFGIFIVYFAWLYFNDKFKISEEIIFVFSWMIIMLISGRSAIRTLFAVAPFVCFSAAYAFKKIFSYALKSKDELLKYIFWAAVIISTLAILTSLFGNPVTQSAGSYQIVSYQAKNIGPSANYQWQEAMAWARNNTQLGSVFVHWWDYGYFVQTLGLRPTVTDGGHANGYWDHLTGRYLLTTNKPETALSYMKTNNVSYLLIDPTDLGKYGAYSKIGGDINNDRFSAPNTMVQDSKQTMESSNGTTYVYTGGSFVDEDINYNGNFLPGPSYDENDLPSYKSYIVGLLLEIQNDKQGAVIKQPQAVYVYNNKQYRIPIRYVYYNGQIIDFKSGIEATFRVIPQVTQTTTGQVSVNQLGAGIYLSPRVSKTLFAKVYLMNDPLNEYPTIKKANFEDDYVITALKQQGMDIGEFAYFNGFIGPLKIWKVDYPDNIIENKGFIAESGQYAELDNSVFTK
jgi:dolichyl-diphosphooligosaccharide--protein glycosyltransferase